VPSAPVQTPPAPVNTNDEVNRHFVDQVYQDMLERAADPLALGFWSGLLGRSSPAQVVLAIGRSAEYLTKQVQEQYGEFLLRDGDSAGVNFWATFLARGGSVEQLKAAFLGSDEYFVSQGGGTTTGFLQALYDAVLNRALDASGMLTWSNALAKGVRRDLVAWVVLTSQESRVNEMQGLFLRYLSRDADPAGLNYFVNLMGAGIRYELVRAAIMASLEYFNDSVSPPIINWRKSQPAPVALEQLLRANFPQGDRPEVGRIIDPDARLPSGRPSSHQEGLAKDFMLSNLGTAASPAQKLLGDQLFRVFVDLAPQLGLKYVIWHGEIWSPSRGVHMYSPSQNDVTHRHEDHIHVEFTHNASQRPSFPPALLQRIDEIRTGLEETGQ
jgi:hypothetical protein